MTSRLPPPIKLQQQNSLSNLLPSSPRGGGGGNSPRNNNNNSNNNIYNVVQTSPRGGQSSTISSSSSTKPPSLTTSTSTTSSSSSLASSQNTEEKLDKLKDITTKTIDQIIFKISEMKREKQFLQSFKDIMKISESLVEIERLLEPIQLSNGESSSSLGNTNGSVDTAAELIKIVHSKSNQSKRGSRVQERSINSIDSLHTILQQSLDHIKGKVLTMKKQLIFETSVQVAIKYGEIIRNIRNQLNSFRTLSLPDNVILCDGEKIHLKLDCRYHLYDNPTSSSSSTTNGNVAAGKENSRVDGKKPNGKGKEKEKDGADPSYGDDQDEYVGGTLYITNYQIIFLGVYQSTPFKRSFSIHSIFKMSKSGKKKSGGEFSYRLNFSLKDARSVALSFDKTNNTLKDVRRCLENLLDVATLFCFTHRTDFSLPEQVSLGWNVYSARDEYARMGVPAPDWKFTHANTNYFLCESYPTMLVVPAAVTDEHLKSVANFRSKGRIPALSYRHWSNKTSITRCSQPRVGISRNRCEEDEFLVNAIRMTGPPATSGVERELYIIDARPYANAVGNRAKGAGWEIMDNYPHCHIEFMGIANIHVMRASLLKVRESLCTSPSKEDNYWSGIDNSGWLQHLKLVMLGAVRVARLLHQTNTNVLIHCSDGWDRTSQLSSLAQIMLDPYFRTVRGFQVLIEKDWLSFGHKFAQRCGQVNGKEEDERAPIFIQFIEAVYQLLVQFPSRFEFNAYFLKTIYTHTYSGKYGNFLYNTEKERIQTHSYGKTISLWLEIDQTLADHLNPLYVLSDDRDVIIPDCSLKRIKIWRQIYFNQVSEVDFYDADEKLVRVAFENALEDRAMVIRSQSPLVPYRTHTASISMRRPSNISQQQLLPPSSTTSTTSSSKPSKPKNLEDLDNNLIIDSVHDKTIPSTPSFSTTLSNSTSPSKSPDKLSSSSSPSTPDKKAISNGFTSLSRGFFKKRSEPKKF